MRRLPGYDMPFYSPPTFVLRVGMKIKTDYHDEATIEGIEVTEPGEKYGGTPVEELDTAKQYGILSLKTEKYGDRWCWTSQVEKILSK